MTTVTINGIEVNKKVIAIKIPYFEDLFSASYSKNKDVYEVDFPENILRYIFGRYDTNVVYEKKPSTSFLEEVITVADFFAIELNPFFLDLAIKGRDLKYLIRWYEVYKNDYSYEKGIKRLKRISNIKKLTPEQVIYFYEVNKKLFNTRNLDKFPKKVKNDNEFWKEVFEASYPNLYLAVYLDRTIFNYFKLFKEPGVLENLEKIIKKLELEDYSLMGGGAYPQYPRNQRVVFSIIIKHFKSFDNSNYLSNFDLVKMVLSFFDRYLTSEEIDRMFKVTSVSYFNEMSDKKTLLYILDFVSNPYNLVKFIYPITQNENLKLLDKMILKPFSSNYFNIDLIYFLYENKYIDHVLTLKLLFTSEYIEDLDDHSYIMEGMKEEKNTKSINKLVNWTLPLEVKDTTEEELELNPKDIILKLYKGLISDKVIKKNDVNYDWILELTEYLNS